MSFDEFQQLISRGANPPAGLGAPLQALWYDARGDWARAHGCVQQATDVAGCWVHAYLHRKEGDDANAGYWYARAGRPQATISLSAEWGLIARTLLAPGDR